MAEVQNLARPSEPADKPFNNYDRTNAGNPNGSLTPQFTGEIILDTTNHVLWKAMGPANSTWVALTAAV